MKTPIQTATEDFISTLLYSWGGDTPPEVIWALKPLVEMINNKLNLKLEVPTEDELYSGDEQQEEKYYEKVKEIEKRLSEIFEIEN